LRLADYLNNLFDDTTVNEHPYNFITDVKSFTFLPTNSLCLFETLYQFVVDAYKPKPLQKFPSTNRVLRALDYVEAD